MKRNFISWLRSLSISVSVMALAASPCAQAKGNTNAYPDHPARLIVPYAPGGATDNIARQLAQKLSEKFNQQFIVENHAGAAGVVGSMALVRAQPDGYTLMLADSQFMIAPQLLKSPPYDPVKSIAPVTQMGVIPLFFVVKSDKPWKSIDELVAYAKANPSKQLTYGTAGIGSVHHLSMEMFNSAADMNLVHVPYKGTGESVQGMMSGDIDVLVASPTAVQAHVKAGTVRQLAITSGERSKNAPDVPSLGESYPGYDYATGMAVLAPAGTPEDVRQVLADAINEVIKQPDMVERLEKMNGMILTGIGPQEFAEIVKNDTARWVEAVKLAGINQTN